MEILTNSINLQGYEESLGFLILGLFIGCFISFASSPTYQFALRAGQGFEAVDPKFVSESSQLPKLNNPDISFIRNYHNDDEKIDKTIIEEGFSIQIPLKQKNSITIGSDNNADIFLPEIPAIAATLLLDERDVRLKSNHDGAVQIQSRRISRSRRGITLRHNQIMTFFHNDDDSKFYRFVFYNRFLDPLA